MSTLCAQSANASSNGISEQAWVEDLSGEMPLSEIKKLPEQPFMGLLSKGYSKAPLWVRLRIDPTPAPAPNTLQTNRNLYLSIRPTFLDSVTLYDLLQDAQQTIAPNQRSGDRVSLNTALPPAPMLLFNLSASDAPRDIWLKIETTSSRIGYFEVLDTLGLMTEISRLEIPGALVLGVLIAFLVWGCVLLFTDRNLLNGIYVFVQLAALVYASSLLSFSRLWFSAYLDTSLVDNLLTYSTIIYPFSAAFFTYALLGDFKIPKGGRAVMYLMLSTPIIAILLAFNGEVRLAMQLNTVVSVLIAPISFLVISYLAKQNPDARHGTVSNLSLVRLYVWLTNISTVFLSAVLLGLIPSPPLFVIYAGLPYAIISGLLMLFLLQYRNVMLRHSEQQMKLDVAQSKQKAKQEERHRRETETLLSVLGHEMKTPLAAVKMLMGAHEVPDVFAHKATRMINTMADLLERTVQANQIEDGAVAIHPVEFDLQLFLENICASAADPTRIKKASDTLALKLHTDPFLLEVVVKNLIDNALKYSPADKPIQVNVTTTSDTKVQIEVSNLPGRAGFPDTTQVFDKYYRHAQASYVSGSGLGLYLGRKLSGYIGADLTYDPDPQYVRFIVTLNYVRAH